MGVCLVLWVVGSMFICGFVGMFPDFKRGAAWVLFWPILLIVAGVKGAMEIVRE